MRDDLAATILEVLDREWRGKVVPKVPSDLAYLVADAILAATPLPMPEKADPVSALREALEIIANAQSMSEWDAQSAIAVKVQYIAHLALKRYRAALSGEAPAGLDGEVERKLDDLWAEAQRSQAVGQDGPMRYGNGIEYAVRAIRRVLADHPIPDVTFDAALSGEAPDRDHPEARCQRCGCPNPAWFVGNDLWNAVMGTPGNPRAEGVIVCPSCFAAAALPGTVWRFTPEWEDHSPNNDEVRGEAPDRDGEVERIATMLRSMPWAGAAALYDAGLRAPSLEGARHPEAGETPLPTVTPIPGFEQMRSAWDVLTPEERERIATDLDRLAKERRRSEASARTIPLP